MNGKAMKDKVTPDQISNSIRKFLFENYLFGYEEDELENDSSFLDLGVLDSTGVMELIGFIENEFNVVVAYSEIIPENLDSVNHVSNFIYNKIY